MTEIRTVTKEEAKAARETAKAYREAERARKAALRERRDERAEELKRHRDAENAAQNRIDGLKNDIAECEKTLKAMNEDIAKRMEMRDKYMADLAQVRGSLWAAYDDRKAARDAIAKLNAQIRGDAGEGACNG